MATDPDIGNIQEIILNVTNKIENCQPTVASFVKD